MEKTINITSRLSDNIKSIENALNIHRIYFSKKGEHSFYNSCTSFKGRPVKSSARYLYKLGESKGITYTMSIGFYFLEDAFYGETPNPLPIEDQRVTISYAFVTKKDCSYSGYHIVNEADKYKKEICSSEQMDINQAKKLFKSFKNDLNDKTDHSPLNIIKLIEKTFMNIDNQNEHSEMNQYLEFMSDDLEIINLNKKAVSKSKDLLLKAKKDQKKEIEKSEEKALFDRLHKELKDATNALTAKRMSTKKKYKINELERELTSTIQELDSSIELVKSNSTAYLEKNKLPFRFVDSISDKLKKDES